MADTSSPTNIVLCQFQATYIFNKKHCDLAHGSSLCSRARVFTWLDPSREGIVFIHVHFTYYGAS
jgi:hypothetical protein